MDFGEGAAGGNDNLQLLNYGGATEETYYWLPKDWMWPVPENDGWADSNTGALAERTIKNGEGYLINLEAAGTKVVYSGEVSTEKTTISDTVQGFNWTGNNTPREISIQDIKLDFGEGAAGGNDNLQLLNYGGATEETYYWLPKDWMWPVPENDGWADSNTGALAEKNLTAGQGFLISLEAAGTKIILPEGYTPAN